MTDFYDTTTDGAWKETLQAERRLITGWASRLIACAHAKQQRERHEALVRGLHDLAGLDLDLPAAVTDVTVDGVTFTTIWDATVKLYHLALRSRCPVCGEATLSPVLRHRSQLAEQLEQFQPEDHLCCPKGAADV